MDSSGKSARFYQQHFYDHLGDRTWDEYKDEENYVFIKQKIAYAMFGPPTGVSDFTKENLANTTFGYTKDQFSTVQPIYQKIMALKKYSPNDSIYMSVIFICVVPEDAKDKGKNYDEIESSRISINPVFRIRKCIKAYATDDNYGCCMFLDTLGRIYDDWEDFLNNSKLPEGMIVAPYKGRYTATTVKDHNRVRLEIVVSPASSTYAKVKRSLDVASTVGSVAAVGIIGVSLFTPVGPILAGTALVSSMTTGIYGIGTSVEHLHDRSSHGQEIGLQDAESRGSWINIAASTTGMAAGASSALLAKAASSGKTIGNTATLAHDVLLISSIATSGSGILNSFASMTIRFADTGELPNTLEIFQFASSILFFTNSVVSNKMASGIIKDSQASSISSVRDTLSNRQRRAFNKMAKETIRLNGHQEGNAIIIRSVNSIENKQHFFRDAARINKHLNEKGVRISFKDGQALFNGQHLVNPSEFYAMNANARTQYLQNIGRADLSTPNVRTNLTSVPQGNVNIPLTTMATGLIQITQLIDSFPDIAGEDENLLAFISYRITALIASSPAAYEMLSQIINWIHSQITARLKEQLLILGFTDTNLLMKIFDVCYNFMRTFFPDDSDFPDLLKMYFVNGSLDKRRAETILNTFTKTINEEYQQYKNREIKCEICLGVRFSK